MMPMPYYFSLIFVHALMISCRTIDHGVQVKASQPPEQYEGAERHPEHSEGSHLEIESVLRGSDTKPHLLAFYQTCDECDEEMDRLAKLQDATSERFSLSLIDVESQPDLAGKLGIVKYPGFVVVHHRRIVVKESGWVFLPVLVDMLEFDPTLTTGFRYQSRPFAGKASVFLISGSQQNANFSQEIVDQRKLWLAAGLSEEQIACYYVRPNYLDYFLDKDQFDAIKEDLSSCYQAEISSIRDHLATSAAKGQPYVYVYVTSHGNHADSGVEVIEARKQQLLAADSLSPRCRAFGDFRLDIEPEESSLVDEEKDLLDLVCSTPQPELVILTPATLRMLLEPWQRRHKFVVLQGCYTGGFITNDLQPQKDTVLTNLPNITILSASRHDRPSFGCSYGDTHSYYGQAVLWALQDAGKKPDEISWPDLHSKVVRMVRQLEQQLQHLQVKPSRPQYFAR